MTTLTSSNCKIYLRDVITSPSALVSNYNAFSGNSVSGLSQNIDGTVFLINNVFFPSSVVYPVTDSIVTSCAGHSDSVPANDTTYLPGDTSFDTAWWTSHTAGADTGAVYTGGLGPSTWKTPYSLLTLTSQIQAAADAASISFEAQCALFDTAFRASGDATAGYCIEITRQDWDGTFSSGTKSIAPSIVARVYLSAYTPAPTGAFSAFPTAINNGESSTLTWTSSNATSASIDNGVGSVTPASGGSVSVSPSVTTTYTLTLTGDGGTTTKTATVTVGHPLPEATFTATPSSVSPSGTATLAWTIAHATSASIDHGVGVVDPTSGTVDVNPTVTTTYTLSMTGLDGSSTQPVTVTVVPDPTGTFTATPSSIFDGQSTVLSWTSSNAVSASIDNGVGTVLPTAAGHVEVFPSETTTYTLTLTNSLGVSADITTTVTVTIRPSFRVFFSEIRQTAIKDWVDATTDLSGTSFDSYLETNQSLHDADLKTQIPYLYTFMKNGEDDSTAIGAFVSIVWDWRSHTDTVKVTTPVQIYSFHDGHRLSVKKVRVNGKGRSLNLRYTSDGDKDFNLNGWVLFYNTQAGQ